MSMIFSSNRLHLAGHHNYLIGGNQANAFCIGDVGNSDDFYIIGVEPPEEITYPLISGNIFDSEGARLFTLVNNSWHWNPKNYVRITGDWFGYEIHDSSGKFILRIDTAFRALNGSTSECWVTTIKGDFYDRSGVLVCHANSGMEGERIESRTKMAFGFAGSGFSINSGYGPIESLFLRHIFASRSEVNQLLTGRIHNREITLDGKFLYNCQIIDCTVHVDEGNFVVDGSLEFQGNNVVSGPRALNILSLVDMVNRSF